jgi:lysophospholipase L1-like esterase
MPPLRLAATLMAVGALALVTAACIGQTAAEDAGNNPQVAANPANPVNPGQLANFHKALADLQGRRVARVTIVQIGDSHTATDHFSGRLRDLFQQRFGDGGRGMLPPGSPFPYWKPYQVEVQQTGRWQVLSSNSSTNGDAGIYGLSGFVVRGSTASEAMTLTASEGRTFDRVEVEVMRQPGGGALDVFIDGRSAGVIESRGNVYDILRRGFDAPGASYLELRPRGNGVVDIADWAVYRRGSGVVLTSHGFSGAQVNLMGRWNGLFLAEQMRHLRPALIIVAFGTNEGFAPQDKLGDYAAEFRARLQALRQAAPGASIVVVGPPDANRLPAYCGRNIGDKRPCVPLSRAEAATYSSRLAGSDRALCRWHTPAAIDYVRRAQQEVARQLNVVFWDWAAVQGGTCGADRWARQELAHRDRVHMRQDGYWQSADQLFTALMRGYRGR